MRRVVLDTNVLVSGNLSRLGSPGRIIDLLNDGALVPLYDSRILAEYETVLCRPRFGFTDVIVTAVMENIRLSGVATTARGLPRVMLPDPTDLPFLEVAVTGAADYLVTGNAAHYVPARGSHSVAIVSPRQYVDMLDQEAEPANLEIGN